MEKVITAVFQEGGGNTVTVYGLWQWDHGISLQIMGLSLPETVEVHFALTNGEPVKQEGKTTDGITTVDIPDSMLAGPTGSGTFCGTQAFLVNAWVYVEDGESGRTVKMIKLNVKTRAKPPDYIATPEEQKTWEQLQEGKADRLEVAGSILSLMSGERLLSEVTLPTGGGEELADIRVGADGKIYNSAGEAVRVQVGELKGDFVKLEDYSKTMENDAKDTLYVTDANGNVVCKIDKDGVHSVGFGGINLALNDVISTYDDSFYIADADGNVVFKADKNGVVGLNIGGSSSGSSSPFKGKKLISIGDSLSAHDKWQKWLVEWLGVTFDNDENINGSNGNPPTAKGGTAVFPNSNDSIYIRSLMVNNYNPDIIIVLLAGNDIPYFTSNSSINLSALGTIDDSPYLKDKIYTELQESEWSDYTAWYQGRPTYYSSLKGLVENLLSKNKSSKLLLVSPPKMWTSDGNQILGHEENAKAIMEVAKFYNIPFVDCWKESGVSYYNGSSYYDTINNVHPSEYGYKRIAETILREVV